MARSISSTKILPSPILPVVRRLGDRLDHLVGQVGGDHDLDLHLRQEAHVVFRAAVDFGLALSAGRTLHLGDREALHAERRQGLAHVVELEGLDNGHDEFHVARPVLLKIASSVSRATAGYRAVSRKS